MYSVVLLMALHGGQALPAQPPRLRGEGGIPWMSPANSEFTNSLNSLHNSPVQVVTVQPPTPARVVSTPVVVPAAAEMNPIRGPTPARILVRLPADARLLIDGEPTRSTSDSRRFLSPPLPPGRNFVYLLRAEVVRQGKTLSEVRDVTVRAGEETVVNLTVPRAQVAGK
jgi:uncharacterized protein (TIGR03000 family)